MVRPISPEPEQLPRSESEERPSGASRWLSRDWRPVAIGLGLALVLLGTIWFFVARSNHVYVSDARVGSDLISISSRVPGWVTKYHVRSSDRVDVGAALVSIDSRDARSRVAELEARLRGTQAERDGLAERVAMVDQQTRRSYEAYESRLVAARTALSAAASELELARNDFERAESLRAQDIVSVQALDRARTVHEEARQSHQRRRADVATAEAALLESEAGLRSLQVVEAQLATLSHEEDGIRAQLEREAQALADHDLRSPIRGVIDRTFAKAGEYVLPGQRLLVMHDPEDVWVDANVRETQIRHLHVGMSASVTVDAYPGEVFEGEITRIGQVATSQFALLPNPNPSGNFTKITQRIPIRIELEQRSGMLGPGMMVEVDIDVRER